MIPTVDDRGTTRKTYYSGTLSKRNLSCTWSEIESEFSAPTFGRLAASTMANKFTLYKKINSTLQGIFFYHYEVR
jgi:hypothetical protein